MVRGRQVAAAGRVWVLAGVIVAAGCSGGGGGQAGVAGSSGQAGTASAGSGGSSGSSGASGGGAFGGAAGAGGRGGGGTAGAGGRGGGGGNPFASAIALTVGANATTATLSAMSAAFDTYSFAGTAGELVSVVTTTAPASNPFDPTYADLVVTLYDPNRLQMAQALDPWPRVADAPALFTLLPATGTYYISVQNCPAEFVSAPPCRLGTGIVNRGYTIRVADITGPTLIREGAEPANDTQAGAAPITYTKAGGASYVPLLLHGVFQSETDRDMFTFAVPADAPMTAGRRARANFWLQPPRTDGNGSTTYLGDIYVVDPADSTGAHIVDVRGTDFGPTWSTDSSPANLSLPVVLGKQYTLVVTRSSVGDATNAFYFVQHLGGAPADAPAVEREPNDTQATANALPPTSNLDGSYTFSVDGDLTTPGVDVDFHRLELPTGATVLTGACQARRIGSGAALLEFRIVDAGGTALSIRTESGNTDETIGQLQIPTAGGLSLRVSAASQRAGTTDSSYVCRFVARP